MSEADIDPAAQPAHSATTMRIHPIIRIPPPLMFVLTFLLGVTLQHYEPLPVHSAVIATFAHEIGFGLVAIGLLVALTCLCIFLWSHTTVIPHGKAAKLVTDGPYRFTRNPMYVSLVALYLGVDGIRGELWPLLLLPLPVIIVNYLVIPFEENRLKQLFGEAYGNYCMKVRRWL